MKNPNISAALRGKPHPHKGGTKGFPCPWKGKSNPGAAKWWKEHPDEAKALVERRILSRRRKSFDRRCEGFLNKYFDNLQFNDGDPTGICKTCGATIHFNDPLVASRVHLNNLPYCTTCKPFSNGPSTGEGELFEFLQSIYNGPIERNNRTVLGGKEIDLFLPDVGIGFEFNGLIWHSTKFKPADRDCRKREEAEDKGIRLIQIWEDAWSDKRAIVESRIRSVLCVGLQTIYARKTLIKEVPASMEREFLDANHLQGYCVSKERFGLFLNGDMVALMTFGPSRFKKGEYELLRYCGKVNTRIIGGAGKLLHHWETLHPGTPLTTYASLDWSIGGLYERLGFSKCGTTPPGFSYTNGRTRVSRFRFQKHKLKGFPWFEASKTAREMLHENGWWEVYDCGNLKFIK